MSSVKPISPVLTVLAALAWPAQSVTAQCFEPVFGTPAATSGQLTGDFVLPIMPIGFAFPLAGATYSDMHLTSKGYLWLSNAGSPAPGGADFSATVAEFASGSPRIAPLWADIQLMAANGAMIYVDSTPARCVITWENLTCYQGTCDAFTMQAQLFPSGEVYFFYGDGATNNSVSTQPAWQVGITGITPGGTVVGSLSDLSVGGVSVDDQIVEQFTAGGSFDMAGTGLYFIPTMPGWVYLTPSGCAQARTYGVGCGAAGQELGLGAIGLPIVGNATFGFEVQNVPNLVPLAFLMFGDTAVDPGVDLTFLGMPGCNAYSSVNLTTASVGVTLPAGTGSVLLPVPATPSLVGAYLTTQALAFSLQTPANLISSNGLEFTVGN